MKILSYRALIRVGLQVKSPDRQWIDAVCMADTVLVQIADLMQMWTADLVLSSVMAAPQTVNSQTVINYYQHLVL